MMLLSVMAEWIKAGFWGLISGSALVIGSLIGYYLKLSQKVIAIIMGFGAGVLISALSFELIDEAFKLGGIYATSVGFIAGALIFSGANYLLNHHGAKHR